MLLKLRLQLERTRHRLVLAESCTAGLVAAEIGKIPGVSEFFCGSMVVYQTLTKAAWLGLDENTLFDPLIGPVSAQVTEQLVKTLLEKTPEATVAAAITGHLGPNAPAAMDGFVYCGFGRRAPETGLAPTVIHHHVLKSACPAHRDDLLSRSRRQREAAELLLHLIIEQLGLESK